MKDLTRFIKIEYSSDLKSLTTLNNSKIQNRSVEQNLQSLESKVSRLRSKWLDLLRDCETPVQINFCNSILDKIDIYNRKMKLVFSGYQVSNLHILRNKKGLSQSQLADLAGVSLRTLQDYEQRTKDINKAAGMTLYKISQVLECSIEDLLEPVID